MLLVVERRLRFCGDAVYCKCFCVLDGKEQSLREAREDNEQA